MLDEVLKNELIEALRPLDPEKIIVFGSYAWGNPNKESDIDLYVITKDEFLPANFKKKIELKAPFEKSIRNIRKKVAIDMIIHTRPMYQRFIERDSAFARDLIKNGVLIYEKSN